MTRVKICGLMRPEDAHFAAECGADALGFVLEPSSPRCLEDLTVINDEAYGPYITKVAVFGPIPMTLPAVSVDAIQGTENLHSIPRMLRRIHTIRLRADDLEIPNLTGIAANAILLDAMTDTGYGGTGEKLNWERLADAVRSSKLPIILAGGLTLDNVAEAIRLVQPYAVDVSSGVEKSPGVKDKSKVRDFISAAKSL